MSEIKPKKMVSRNVAIALGIICIVLAVGLVASITIIDDKNTTYNRYVSSHPYTGSEYDHLEIFLDNYMITHTFNNSEFNSILDRNGILQGQVNDLNSTVNLAKSEVGVNSQTVSQPADNYSFWIPSCSYAGYLSVQVESSTTDKTYTEVLWNSYGINYDNRISVGTNGTGIFPVLPSRIVQVRVGNTNTVDNATETVTITYYY